jgi:hypothetical protein
VSRTSLVESIRVAIGAGSRRWVAGFALAAVWLAAVIVTLGWLMRYDNTPGVAADPPATWPAGTAIARDPAGPTLVMLAHPRCDCTQASLGELAELLARAPRRPRAFVVFIRPAAVGHDWEKTGLWNQAGRIPGVTVLRDDEGSEARRFGVQTSGQTLLYDARGRLIYRGGTTGARGKAGDNAGRAALLGLLTGASTSLATSPVFGCSLFSGGEDTARAEAHPHGS